MAILAKNLILSTFLGFCWKKNVILLNLAYMTGRMELLRLLDRGSVAGGAAGRGRVRSLHAAFLQAAQVREQIQRLFMFQSIDGTSFAMIINAFFLDEILIKSYPMANILFN